MKTYGVILFVLFSITSLAANEDRHREDVREAFFASPELSEPAVRRLGEGKWIEDLRYVWFRSMDKNIRTLAATYLARIETMHGILETLRGDAKRFSKEECSERIKELDAVEQELLKLSPLKPAPK